MLVVLLVFSITSRVTRKRPFGFILLFFHQHGTYLMINFVFFLFSGMCLERMPFGVACRFLLVDSVMNN